MVGHPCTAVKDYEIYMGCGYDIEDYGNRYIDEEVIYCGYLDNHWGHFLIDYSTRLWLPLIDTDKKCIFLVKEKKNFTVMKNIERFFELLGIEKNRIMLINEVTCCKTIIIPEVSYRSNDYYSKEYLNMFEVVASNIEISQFTAMHRKIYFTRSQFKKACSSEVGGVMLDDLFKDNGFYVVAPEKCSLDFQIMLIRNSDILVGISGTMVHNMIFAKEGQRLIVVNKTYSMNMMQMDIDYMRKLDVTYIDSYVSLFPVRLGIGPFMFIYNENLERFIYDRGYVDVKDNYKSERYKRKCFRKYIKLYRKYFFSNIKMHFEDDSISVHYFDSENLKNILNKYYAVFAPAKISERGRIVFGRGKKIVKSVLRRF